MPAALTKENEMRNLKIIHYYINLLAAILIIGGLLAGLILWLVDIKDLVGGALLVVFVTLFSISVIQLSITIGMSVYRLTRSIFITHLLYSAIYLIVFIPSMYFGFPYFVDDGYDYLAFFFVVVFLPCVPLLLSYFKITYHNFNPISSFNNEKNQ